MFLEYRKIEKLYSIIKSKYYQIWMNNIGNLILIQ
jgi:hypothetical protein